MALATLDYIKAYLAITDTNSDDLLSNQIMPAAQAAIEGYVKQPLEVNTYTDLMRGPDDYVLQLWHIPIASITSITINPDETNPEVIAGNQLTFDPKRGQVWVNRSNSSNTHFFRSCYIPNILVSYQAGYSTIPDDLQQAYALVCKTLMMQVGHTSDSQTLTSEKIGDWQATYARATAFISQDLDIRAILDRYKDFSQGIGGR
jgi:hypothetical protein